MSVLVRAELTKLATVRSTYLVAALALALAAALTAVALTPAHARVDDIGPLVAYPAFLIALVGAHGLAAEYERGMVASLYTLVPRRERLLAAKAVAAAVFGALTGLLMSALMLAIAAVWLHHFDEAWTWSAAQTIRCVVGMTIVTATFAVAGVGFGALIRLAAGATGALSLVYLGLSGLLGGLSGLGGWTSYGIGGAQLAAVQPSTAHALAFAPALALNAGYCAIFLVIGITVARRTDV